LLPRFWTAPLLLTLCACAAAVDPSPTVLTGTGLGVVRLGMTVTQAQQALGAALSPMPPGFEAACWITRRADGRAPEVFYTIENDKITRIDINIASSAGMPTDVATVEGIGVGATEADVQRVYGKATKVMPSKDDAHGHTLVVEKPDAKSALVFETADGKVTTFRAGYHPSVDSGAACR
jgi:hypothetical protein